MPRLKTVLLPANRFQHQARRMARKIISDVSPDLSVRGRGRYASPWNVARRPGLVMARQRRIPSVATDQFLAASKGAAAIKSFVADGGRFTDRQDENGLTAGMWAAFSGADAIRAFAAAGGQFTDQEDKDGWTAGMFAAVRGAKAIKAFAAAGGKFTDKTSKNGWTAGLFAAMRGAEAIKEFAQAGGRFTNRADVNGKKARMLAGKHGKEALDALDAEWAAQRAALAHRRPTIPP